MGVRGWRKISKVTDAWKLVLREPGSYMDRRATGERERERIIQLGVTATPKTSVDCHVGNGIYVTYITTQNGITNCLPFSACVCSDRNLVYSCTGFSNYDGTNVLVKAGGPIFVRRLRRAQTASYN